MDIREYQKINAPIYCSGATRLKCGNIIFLWGGHLVRPGRARCPSHKSLNNALF
ncbi:hypothetical protein FDUTEX481_00766 [Tolypothrix sp. PCC 7601]|nr:hypothetical protein FDUTEX481_00766 [Tolypothrix sp. PCC 7601]